MADNRTLTSAAPDRLTLFLCAVFGLSVDDVRSLPPWTRLLLAALHKRDADAAVTADERYEGEEGGEG